MMLLLLVAAGALLLCSYIGLNLFRYTAQMDSDIAAEGLIARAMWEHGSIIPSEFYPSSETRIFNVNLLAAGIYGLMGDMNLSIGLACCVLMVVMIALYVVLLRRLRLGGVSVAAAVLMLLAAPVTMRHAQILYLYAVYYTIHSILMLMTLMMWLHVVHESDESRGWIWRTVVSSAFAFVISLSGLRAALVCYAPLLLVVGLEFVLHLWRKRGQICQAIRPVLFAFVTMLCAYVGTMMPTSIGIGTTRNMRKGPAKLIGTVIPDMLESISLGEQDTVRNVILVILLLLIVCSIVLLLIQTVRSDGGCERAAAGDVPCDDAEGNGAWPDSSEQCSQESPAVVTLQDTCIIGDRFRIMAFYIVSLGLTMLMSAFTTTESVWRYYFMIYFVMSFAVGLLVDRLMVSHGIRNLGAYAVSVLVIVYALLIWRSELLPTLQRPVYNGEYETIISWMQENDYYYGYSTYETSNAMTGYANGAVQISAVSDLGQMDICMWLTDKTWYGPYVAADTKTAYIVPVSMEDAFAPMREGHEDMELVLETEYYHVYASPTNYSWQ